VEDFKNLLRSLCTATAQRKDTDLIVNTHDNQLARCKTFLS
jgi:hypothetical protein